MGEFFSLFGFSVALRCRPRTELLLSTTGVRCTRAGTICRLGIAMSRDDLIEFEGTVIKVANGTYHVQVSDSHVVVARLKKRLKRFRIRVVLGDEVTVAVSPYDPTRGFITYRRS